VSVVRDLIIVLVTKFKVIGNTAFIQEGKIMSCEFASVLRQGTTGFRFLKLCRKSRTPVIFSNIFNRSGPNMFEARYLWRYILGYNGAPRENGTEVSSVHLVTSWYSNVHVRQYLKSF